MSLGAGLSKLAGKAFRIGHLGSFNDLMLAGTLSGTEMGLRLAGIPHRDGGVSAALEYLAPSQERTAADPINATVTEVTSLQTSILMRVDSGLRAGPRKRVPATTIVLLLICVMYGITYIDRVNVSTAASVFQKDLRLST